MPINNLIQFRKGTDWSNDPILASGEPGFDVANNILKVGDGTSAWSSLVPVNSGWTGDDADTELLAGSGILFDASQAGKLYISVSGNLLTTNIADDTSPQLGGNLDLNSYSVTGVGNINISGNITANTGNFDILSFDINNESILTKGQISWDDTEGTMGIGLTDNTTIHIGSHRYFRIRNETGGTLYKGQVVYATGVHANGIIEPALYVADGTIREVRFMGVILEDVNHQNNGYVIDFGHLESMDLDGSATNYAVGDETWSAGDILYVHPTGAGKLTKNEPKHSISVAIILDVGNGNGNGRMFVRPTSYGHLDDNHDVAVSGATNGQFLQYNSATDYWVPSSSGNFTTLQVNGAYTFPTTDGDPDQVLQTDGAGNVSWATVGAAGGGGVAINNYADNRVLTSDGSISGINAESKLVFIPTSSGNKLGVGTTNPNGNISLSNGAFAIDGDSQRTILTARQVTTNATQNTLYLDGSSTKIVLPPKAVWNFDVRLSCYSDTNEGVASWNFRGCIKRTSSTTAIVGSVIEENFIDSSLNGVVASVVAHTGTSSLDINVNGLASNDIRWTASVDFVQTKYDINNYAYPLSYENNMVP